MIELNHIPSIFDNLHRSGNLEQPRTNEVLLNKYQLASCVIENMIGNEGHLWIVLVAGEETTNLDSAGQRRRENENKPP